MIPLETIFGIVEYACQDIPQKSLAVNSGEFVLTLRSARDGWQEIVKQMGVPSKKSTQIDNGDHLIIKWPSYADQIFGTGGLLSGVFDGYEVRDAQLHAGRMFQRSVELGVPLVAELPVGTGKTFVYLLVGRAMGLTIAVSTSNKALQMQIYDKDSVLVNKLFPSRFALVQGKNNYVCRLYHEDRRGLMPAAINAWVDKTETGNIQEIPFEVAPDVLKPIMIDEDCRRNRCPLIGQCFYYKAKDARDRANVLVMNHTLLALNELYPYAGILPEGIDVVVVDEAHNLRNYVTSQLSQTLTRPQIDRLWRIFLDYGVEQADAIYAADLRDSFYAHVSAYVRGKNDPEVGIKSRDTFPDGLKLAEQLRLIAEKIWDADDAPSNEFEDRAKRVAAKIRAMSDKIRLISDVTPEGHVRWITEQDRLTIAPYDVSAFIGQIAGFIHRPKKHDADCCTECGKKLTADHVYMLHFHPFCPECQEVVDIMDMAEMVSLTDYLAEKESMEKPIVMRKPIMFTSATLAAPDLDFFMRESGLPFALKMQAQSPFPYENSLLYVPPKNAPSVKATQEFQAFMVSDIERLVKASKGGAFLLFTSYTDLEYTYDRLAVRFTRMGLTVFKQGNNLSKMEIIRRFKTCGNGVLFATESFFEGVDIPGDELRLVVISKIPIPAPTPLNTAKAAHLTEWARANLNLGPDELEWYAFNNLSVPEATIKLVQASGRLVRRVTDKGVVAVLDNRLKQTKYGNTAIMRALPPFTLVRTVDLAAGFFAE